MRNPLAESAGSDPEDRELVFQAQGGNREALEQLITRHQAWIYNILGEISGVTDLVGAELLEISRENFRQKLARARRDLHNFLHDKCGLVDEANPCRCAKKTQGFMKAGFVDPRNLLFAREHVTRVRDVAEKTCHLPTASLIPASRSSTAPFVQPNPTWLAL